jgi:tetratricopeptide (TPR) repeat protein
MRSLSLTFLLILAFAVAGCGARKVTPVNSSSNAPATATSDDVLTSAIHQLRPENFGVNATTDKPVSLLNSWRFKQAEIQNVSDQATIDKPVPVKAPFGWVSPDEKPRLDQAKYDGLDASHIRDALFNRVVAGYLSDRGQGDLQKVAIIVDFVCRNVALWRDDEIELPLLPYVSLQLGCGSPDDRAWICAEILKQLRIDSVVLRPKTAKKTTGDNWLFGVLVEGQVYLFDMLLGLPIANDSNASVATLAEIVSHPEWLEQMSVNEPYRLTVDDLRESVVYVITNANFWSYRMHNLEQVLPPSDLCVLFDPLTDDEGQIGQLNRIAKSGGWPVESLKSWTYPRLQMIEARSPSEEKVQELQRFTLPFSVPIPVKYDEQNKPALGVPERKMQKTRSEHLLGKFADATAKYLRIRHLEVEPNPPDIARINRAASEDAFYWTTLCKFEMGEYATAVELLTDYLKKYDRKGRWYFPARTLLAQSYAKLDQLPKAITTLERSSSDDPYRQANAVRVKRWIGQTKSKL